MLEERRLPANIEVIEFYLEPGAWLGERHHAAALPERQLHPRAARCDRPRPQRAATARRTASAGRRGGGHPEPRFECGSDRGSAARSSTRCAPRGRPFVLVGQQHRELPFMYGDALVPESRFDYLVDEPASSFPLFAPPNLPIPLTEHAIALNVSALVKDGGTLQLGIGELGDAITSAIFAAAPAQSRSTAKPLRPAASSSATRSLIEAGGRHRSFRARAVRLFRDAGRRISSISTAPVCSSAAYIPNARLQRLLDDGRDRRERWRPRCSTRWLPGGWTDSRRRNSTSCARPVSFAMK